MKLILPIFALILLTPALEAGEKDVWYNAKGKAVKVTPAEKEKKPFVPLWKQRELEREANQSARLQNRVRNSGNRYHYAYPGYGSYGYSPYSGYGGCYGGYSYPRYSRHHHRYQHRPHSMFSGTYTGKGWSVRLRY